MAYEEDEFNLDEIVSNALDNTNIGVPTELEQNNINEQAAEPVVKDEKAEQAAAPIEKVVTAENHSSIEQSDDASESSEFDVRPVHFGRAFRGRNNYRRGYNARPTQGRASAFAYTERRPLICPNGKKCMYISKMETDLSIALWESNDTTHFTSPKCYHPQEEIPCRNGSADMCGRKDCPFNHDYYVSADDFSKSFTAKYSVAKQPDASQPAAGCGQAQTHLSTEANEFVMGASGHNTRTKHTMPMPMAMATPMQMPMQMPMPMAMQMPMPMAMPMQMMMAPPSGTQYAWMLVPMQPMMQPQNPQ